MPCEFQFFSLTGFDVVACDCLCLSEAKGMIKNMNLVGSHVQIIWKDIFLTIVFIYGIRFLLDSYIIKGFKRVHKAFYSDDWNSLEGQIEKYQKISDQFSNGPWNKKIETFTIHYAHLEHQLH